VVKSRPPWHGVGELPQRAFVGYVLMEVYGGFQSMGVALNHPFLRFSINGDIPSEHWMVYFMENPIEMI
jgi:hypothetical protein